MSWETLCDTVCRLSLKKRLNEKYSSNIALFDLDGTLIKTKSGAKFPKNAMDWEFWHENVIVKLKEITKAGDTIIIITNQAVTSDRREIILERIESAFAEICETCDPRYIECYVALAKDLYRKPCTSFFEKWIYPTVKINKIYYVGDAAGRKGDFSDSDRKFAFNLQLFLRSQLDKNAPTITFYTPNEYFLCAFTENKNWTGFDPYSYFIEHKTPIELNFIEPKKKYAIIMMGPPASGKSTMSREIVDKFPNSLIVNQDTEKTKAKCLKLFDDALGQMANDLDIIIVDNMNATKATRATYIKKVRAAQKNISIICIFMADSKDVCTHMQMYREKLAFHNKIIAKHIPAVVYNKYYKDIEKPSQKEGFDHIVNWAMAPKFTTKYELYMYLQKG
jgi:bifunctional polynucleotide phosphatase/kinase